MSGLGCRDGIGLERNVPLNPLKERGLERFTTPQSPVEMLTGRKRRSAISTIKFAQVAILLS